MEEEVANLKEKLEVSDVKCSLLTEECNKMKSQLEELLRVKEVSLAPTSLILFLSFRWRLIHQLHLEYCSLHFFLSDLVRI